MATYKELIYMVMDKAGVYSDDSIWTADHIRFMLNYYRSFLLKQRYSDSRKEVPQSNFQILCEPTGTTASLCLTKGYVSTKRPIPDIIQIGLLSDSISVTDSDYMSSGFSMIDYNRFVWAGDNPRMRNIIYGTLGPDLRIYLRSKNNRFRYLKKVKIIGLFNDALAARERECDKDNYDDIDDMTFPIENSLIAPLIDLTHDSILKGQYRPEDKTNNADDGLTNVKTNG